MSEVTLEHLHAMLLQVLSEQQATRTEIAATMATLQRMEGTLSGFRDIPMDWLQADQMEKKVEADREQINALVKMINELVTMNRAIEGRVAALEDKR